MTSAIQGLIIALLSGFFVSLVTGASIGFSSAMRLPGGALATGIVIALNCSGSSWYWGCAGGVCGILGHVLYIVVVRSFAHV